MSSRAARPARLQSPCNDPFLKGLCCANASAGNPNLICSNWTGVRLESAGCILYGTPPR